MEDVNISPQDSIQVLAELNATLDELYSQKQSWNKSDDITQELYQKCIKVCETALKKESSESNKFFQEEEIEAHVYSPEANIVQEIRNNLRKNYQSSVPQELQEWLIHWPNKVDGKVFPHALTWIYEASKAFDKHALLWQEKLIQAKPNQFGFFSRIRTLFLSNTYKKVKDSVKDLENIIKNQKNKLSEAVNFTKLSAGMLSVSLKLGTGYLTEQHKIIRKVFELEQMSEVLTHLQYACEEVQQRIFEKEEMREKIQAAIAQKMAEQKQIEYKKEAQILNIYTQSSQDPRKILARATEMQIRLTYGDVENIIVKQQNELVSKQTQIKEIGKEFVRLAEVVHEYSRDKDRTTKTRESVRAPQKPGKSHSMH